MANYANLKSAIQQVVKTNGNEEITGALLQQSLLAMIDSLGGYYQFAGIATPSTNPGTPDQNVFYIASIAGTYSNFGGILLDSGEVAILTYNGSWTKRTSGFASEEKLNELYNDVNGGDKDITPTTGSGYYYDNSGNNILIYASGPSHYSGTIVNTSTPPSNGIDISGYIGKTIKITMASISSGSSRKTIIANQNLSVIDAFPELTYTQDVGYTTYSKTFVVPSGAKWLFWSGVGNLVSIIVVNGESGGGLRGEILELSGKVDEMGLEIQGLEDSKEKTDFLSIGGSANLFNKNDPDVKIGFYLYGNTFYASESYNVSGFIPVDPLTTYYAAVGGGQYRFASYYNSQKEYISNSVFGSGSDNFTTPENCAFVRVTFYANTYNTAQVSKIQTSYVEYFRFLKTVQGIGDDAIARLKDIAAYSGNILYGKKWVACGDSFTHGDFTNAPVDNYHIQDGIYSGQYKVYPFIIGNRNGMEIVNEAVNGSTMTYVGGNRFEFSTPNGRYTQIPEDADYITLKFGINDDTAHAGAPIGTIDDNTNETFYGAWNIVMDYIIRHHPQAKIGIIVTNGSQLPYVEAIIAIAEKWGISYLNEATDPQCSFMFRSNRTDVLQSIRAFRNENWYVEPSLNSHPNAAAHEYESTVVEAWLRTL